MQTFTGYMAHATWDGHTLTLVGHNKPAKVALAGEDWERDIVLTRDQILSVDSKAPSRLVNGWVKINGGDGWGKYQVNFRHKQADEWAALVAVLTE